MTAPTRPDHRTPPDFGPPDLTGRAGQAWRATHSPDELVQWPASVALWLVHQPGVHAFWSIWRLGVVSLRELPGLPPAHKTQPNASHEFMIDSVNPDYEPKADWRLVTGKHLMTPTDLVTQAADLTDEQAAEVAARLVRMFCDGLSAADSDFRHANMKLIENMAEQIRRGN